MLPTAPFGEAKSYSTDDLTASGAGAAATGSSDAFAATATRRLIWRRFLLYSVVK